MHTELRHESADERYYLSWFGPCPGTYLCRTTVNKFSGKISLDWFHGEEAIAVFEAHSEVAINAIRLKLENPDFADEAEHNAELMSRNRQ